ncbi:DNA repair protein complementing XP-G cells isoform X2 [Oopsacas minuta]|uniref:DNA repair protein complementing XP-G cells isoform X2 n=1 Tax=Oopsacas minuta TaxID=111878 RepID=A0AAV7JMX0_9METZ|nr:DNA repair protein complementing XP-G cells isoform X2 [Oopsacas minuta]
MGVKHLWAILQGAGTSIDYDSLQGQVISVDINIWLHQIQSHRIGQNPHAYLIDLLKRICKLLNYGIKPIFVFDGAHPKLKRDTIISRDLRRKNAQKQHDEAKFKHILKTIHSQLLQGQVPFIPPSNSSGPSDLFELPTSSTVFENSDDEYPYDELTSIDQIIRLNPKSEEFSNLPSDIQVSILKLKQKISIASISNDQTGIQDDSHKPEDISNRQIQNLLERREIRQKIDSINNEHREKINSSIIGIETDGFDVQSDKIISHDKKHVIIVKNQNSTPLKISNETNNYPLEDNSAYTPVTDLGRYYDGTDIPEPQNGALTQEMTSDTMDVINPFHLVKVSFTNGTEIYAEQAPNGELTSITSYHSQSGIDGINPGCVSSSFHTTDELSPPLEGIHLAPNLHGSKRSKTAKDNIIKMSADLGLVIPPKSAVKSTECLSHVSDDVFHNTPSSTPIAKRVCVQDTPAMEGDTKLELYTVTVPNSFSEESIPPTPISPSYDTTDQLNPCLEPLPPTPSSEEYSPSNEAIQSSEPSILIGSDPILATSSSLEDIRREMSELTKVVTRNQRIMQGINREIQDAVMELLAVFGIPYIVAPFEAEAQCANLELNKVTTGTITDDSDIFLFGGHTVYRHFFNMKSRLGTECYSMNDINKCLELRREDLIRLAFLLGCDYTEGVKGIGPKHAIPLLKSFKSEGLQPLTDILSVAETAKMRDQPPCGGEDGLLARVDFPRGFPDENVWNAFLKPLVDPVPIEEFKWGTIEVDKFVNFSKKYFNWKESQAREQITPVIRRQSTPKQVQLKIPRTTHRPVPSAPPKANYSRAKLSDSD